MKTQKVLLKTAYCLAGVLILVSIGFNIFQYQRNKRLSEKPVPEKIAKNESTSDSISNSESAPVKIVQKSERKSTVPISKEEKSITSEIDELEYHLNAAEEELDMTSEQLSDELSQKAKYKKAYDKGQKIIKSNPAFQKSIRDSVTQTILKNYDPLFEKLNISEEEFDEFKGMLADSIMEIQSVVLPNIRAASDEEKAKMNQQAKEIRDKYDNKISEFLGRKNNEIYQSYRKSLSERSSLNYFMETVSPENRISEEQTEVLIDSMYAARKAVYDEMGPDIDITSSSELTEENIAHQIEKTKRVYDKYVEASRGILPAEQAEQYKAYLKQNLDITEANLKMNLFLKHNNNGKEDKPVND